MPVAVQTQLSDVETMEIELLLDGVYRLYGCDFRNYALASLRRRIWNSVRTEGAATISGLQEKILHKIHKMTDVHADKVVFTDVTVQ